MSYAEYDKFSSSSRFDQGHGIDQISPELLTVSDVYRTPFLFLNEHKKKYFHAGQVVMDKINNGDTATMFWSVENKRRLQEQIKKEVFIRSHRMFKLSADQDPQELDDAMYYIFTENAIASTNPIRQTKKLNKQVIDHIMPGIMTNVSQFYGYMRDIDKPLDPIPLPICDHGHGRKAPLPSVTTLWGF